jgi:hypothetical protein
VVKIKFFSSSSAENCISRLDQGKFDGRILKCYFWDGKTDYRRVQEDKEVLDKRIEEFGAWLDQG